MALNPNITTAADMLAKTQVYSDLETQQDEQLAQQHGRVFNAIQQAAKRGESQVDWTTNELTYDWAGLITFLTKYGYACSLNQESRVLSITWR